MEEDRPHPPVSHRAAPAARQVLQMERSVATSDLPAVLAKKRNESHGRNVLPRELHSRLREKMQNLLLAVAKRYQETPAVGELLLISHRNLRRRCPDENSIERGKLPPPEGSVTEHVGDV